MFGFVLLGVQFCLGQVFAISEDASVGDVSSNSLEYLVKREVALNPELFTQGLVIEEDTLYVGTGLYGKSVLQAIDLDSMNVVREQRLAKEFFGEGVTVWGDRIYQLTWKVGMAFVYSADDFQLEDILNYNTEGWGITHDSESVIMSDGTEYLSFREKDSFKLRKRLEVTENGKPLRYLNELEFCGDWILANVWRTNRVVVIDVKSGVVVANLDLTSIVQQVASKGRKVDVLNGVAVDWKRSELWITGKLWGVAFVLDVPFLFPQNEE